jgi:hypothetical protein
MAFESTSFTKSAIGMVAGGVLGLLTADLPLQGKMAGK